MSYWLDWLVEHTPKSVQYKFTKLSRLTARQSKEGATIVLKSLFLTERAVLKRQRALLKEEKEPKYLIFDFGCTAW